MGPSLQKIIESYDADAPVEEAWTIAAPFYIDPRIADLERRTVFNHSWQVVGRTGQVEKPGEHLFHRLLVEDLRRGLSDE